MSGALDPRTPVSDLDRIAAELGRVKDRLDLLEAPSGTSAFRSVEKLTALVNDIQAALDEYNATRWTNAQIQSAIDGTISSRLGASQTIGGNITIGGEFRSPNAYGFDITYTRRTAWLGNDGRLGYASSSRDKKAAIRDADEERLSLLLDIVPKSFYYRAEIARRTRLRINDGVDYAPEREVGLIAQDLDEAGLQEFVIYGEHGEPEGIEYGMLTVALLAAARLERARREALAADVAEIRAHLGLGSES